jgi:hypothetical protein
MLQKMEILLFLGGVVLFCAVGCEEDASVQVRPVNNQPGKAAPFPAGATTQPAARPTEPAPAVKSSDKPVAIHKASQSPTDAKILRQPFAKNSELSPKQVHLFDSMRQESLKLQMQLDELHVQNERLTRALLDSRNTGRSLQSNLQRSTIVQEIQKRELRELQGRLGQTATASDAKDAAETAQVAQSDPANLMLEIGRLRGKTEKLRLQLQLAQLDTPDARQKVLVKLGETAEQNEKLETLNRKLSHMVVAQSDQIRELRQREEELNHLQADHADQIANMSRQTRKELATMEIKIVEDRKHIDGLKDQIARRDSEIRTLKEQLTAAKTVPAASKIAAAPKPEKQPTPVSQKRPVLIKVAPVEPADTVAAAPEPVIEPAPRPIKRPAPKPTPEKAPQQAVVAPPVFSENPETAPIDQPIAGKITAVKGHMVMVDVGKNLGVEPGMRLISYREDKFVGYLRVEQVARREAACSFSRQILPPRIGDHVVDRLE